MGACASGNTEEPVDAPSIARVLSMRNQKNAPKSKDMKVLFMGTCG